LRVDSRSSISKRRSVAIVHLAEEWLGGGEAVALASVEALKDEFDVTLIGVTRPDLNRMNSLFGTRLGWADVRWRPVPPTPGLLRLFSDGGFVQGVLHPLRFCRSVAPEYDLMLSTFNDMDLGKPAIQYCHHPGMAMAFQPEIVRRMIDGETTLPRFFHSRCRLHRAIAAASGYRERRVRRNVTLANSSWTARIMEQAYDRAVDVVYPPVAEIPGPLPWEERENGFLCVGRCVRTKRIHVMIEILERVRALGFDVHLHVVSSHAAPDYLAQLRPSLQAHAAWVHLEWDLPQERVFQLLSRHRYGIHAMENEHFGIAVAEMVKAGMIPFVPDSGGQVEIVDEPRLTYADVEDAAAKIGALLGNPDLQRGVLKHLTGQSARFSRERFAAKLQASVARRLA
jgi:glycosyltransferase involved in cell wall biosynthesis